MLSATAMEELRLAVRLTSAAYELDAQTLRRRVQLAVEPRPGQALLLKTGFESAVAHMYLKSGYMQ